MKVSVWFKILSEVYPILSRERIVDTSGNFNGPTPETRLRLTPEIAAILKANGVTVQKEA